MRLTGLGGAICATALLATCATVGTADGAFPGRDGRLIWTESGYDGGTSHPNSPAGRTFLFGQEPGLGETGADVGGLDCDATSSRSLCPYGAPSVSPDGRRFVFSAGKPLTSERPPDRRFVLAVAGMNVAASHGVADDPLPALTDADRDPAWSPDGERIVFSGEVDGNRDLYVVGTDGSNLRRLTFHPKADFEPTWSTRGEIAYVRRSVLYRIRPDGSGPRSLGRRGRRPDWSPSGSRLVFNRRGRIYTVGRTGGRQRRLTRRGGLYPAWSPSGRRIAFRRNYDIYTVGSSGRRLRRVYDWVRPNAPGPSWVYAPRAIDWGPRQR